MKFLFAITWLAIFSSICIEPMSLNRSIDGACIERCINSGKDLTYCKYKCTKC